MRSFAGVRASLGWTRQSLIPLRGRIWRYDAANVCGCTRVGAGAGKGRGAHSRWRAERSECQRGPDSGWKWTRERYAMHRTVSLLLLALPAFGQEPFTWKDLGGGRVELSEGGKPALVYNFPVLLTGGVRDGRGLAAALAMGAEGVAMGTRFILSHDNSDWHPAYLQALLDAGEGDDVAFNGVRS